MTDIRHPDVENDEDRSFLTQEMVWDAADRIWKDSGGKTMPSCPNVRLAIGRGSPNTISKHLKTWKSARNVEPQDPEVMTKDEQGGSGSSPHLDPAAASIILLAKNLETRHLSLDSRVETNRQEARADISSMKTEFAQSTNGLKEDFKNRTDHLKGELSAEIKRLEQVHAARLTSVMVTMSLCFLTLVAIGGGGGYWALTSLPITPPLQPNNTTPVVTPPTVIPPIESTHGQDGGDKKNIPEPAVEKKNNEEGGDNALKPKSVVPENIKPPAVTVGSDPL